MHQDEGHEGFWKRCHLHFTCFGADVGDAIKSPRVRGASTVPLVDS